MSGGGKSTALNILEDQGMYAIDNIPPSLLPQLLDMLGRHRAAVGSGLAAVVDVRSENLLEDFFSVISELRRFVPLVQVVYLDAADSTLVRRFEATRRRHPLAGEAPIHEGVLLERELMERLRRVADVHIDTTRLSPTELRTRLLTDLGWISATPSLVVSSFGFKYGAPQDCDYLLDVRFLPNPNYEPELHSLSGRDEPVRVYLDGFPETRAFLERLENLLALVIPLYERTGKNPIHVAVGCTGGRHRSVAIAEHLGTYLSGLGQRILVRHRDCDREPPR
jgi:UPF0042 nucleotide-binding protein